MTFLQFSLPPLPYDQEALSPLISQQTFSYHYNKHHQAYITKLNALLKHKDHGGRYTTLEEIITLNPEGSPIHNQAAQVWNHGFYWHSMTPRYLTPDATMVLKIQESFGSYEKFCSEFQERAVGHFGSGWLWLVQKDDGTLGLQTTTNAGIPKDNPLVVCDLWEHAYYLDYQNERGAYVDRFLNHLLSWSFVEQCMKTPWTWEISA